MILRRGVNSDPRGGEGAQRHKRLGVLKQSSPRVSERESLKLVCPLLSSALKMKIKEVKKEKGDRKLVAAQKKKKVLKQGVLRKKDLKKLTLYIKNGANCPCSQLDSLGSNFLIMGRKVEQQLLLMSIHKWDKKSKELKYAIKYMKSHQCPTYHTVFQ